MVAIAANDHLIGCFSRVASGRERAAADVRPRQAKVTS